jgi:energy-coupling factor transporter ATP-binding protein EcfA2
MRAHRRFVVVWGLPGSGKSTLARRLAGVLNLPVIDKDDILEGLYASKGVGDVAWRRALSRESDRMFQGQATASMGALLVSHWHLTGMPVDSGTPTDWLSNLSGRVVNLHCVCTPEIAAGRFVRRKRHAGHLDSGASELEMLASLRRIADLGLPDIGNWIEVDTSQEPSLDSIVREIFAAFQLFAEGGGE